MRTTAWIRCHAFAFLLLAFDPSNEVFAAAGYQYTVLAGAARNRHVDGDATQATFYNIEAIARDEAGNLYLADSNNHAIRKLSTNGIVSTLVGDADSGALTVFPIGNPRALAFDPNGNLLIGGNAIWRLTPLGDVTVVLDGLTVNCLAVARDGTIYVGEGGFSARIRKIAPNGTVSVLAGDAPIEGRRDGVGTDARFNWIAGLAIGPDGMLYASDSNRSNSIRRISPDGVVTTFFDFGSSFMGPEALAFDSEGNLFVGCWGESTIFRLDPGGRIQPYAGSRGGVETIDAGVPMARFGSSYGNILYSSGPGWLLYSWQDGYADGLTLARIASTPGATVSEDAAVLGSPSGLVFDSSDTLYVADGSAVRRITTDGVVRTIAGIPGSGGHRDGQGANARFFGPQGIAVDRGGNVFVAEEKSSTLRKITPAGVVSTVAGTPGRPGHKDAVFSARAMRINIAGSPVTAEDSRDTAGDSRTRLSTPYSVAIGPEGQVYIADLGSSCIRKLSANGLQTLVCLPNGTSLAGIACDKAGNIYATAPYNYVVWKVTPQGQASILAGAWGQSGFTDGTGSNARFSRMWIGIAVDDAGNVFVSDTGNDAVRKITAQGEVTTLAGGHYGTADGTGSAAQFVSPYGLAVDSDGNVLVTSGRAVRKITPSGVVTTLPGTPLPSGDPRFDNGYGQLGSASWLRGLALDTAGNIYVTDAFSDRIIRMQYMPPSRLTNISIRALNGAGEDNLIAGFVTKGSDTEKVLVRGIGPTLARYSVENPDPDPELRVWGTRQNLVDRNDNWGKTLADVFKCAGAFDLPTGSKDAALVTVLEEGGYTAQLAGSQSGAALVELYELEPRANSRLVNVSGRVRVGADAATALVAGFTISPGIAKRVLIRGVGPGLSQYGVKSFVKTPELTIINQSTSRVVATARSWGGASSLVDSFNRVGAFPLPSDSSDAALLITLEPGSYTARLTSLDGTVGVGLLEVFDAD